MDKPHVKFIIKRDLVLHADMLPASKIQFQPPLKTHFIVVREGVKCTLLCCQ